MTPFLALREKAHVQHVYIYMYMHEILYSKLFSEISGKNDLLELLMTTFFCSFVLVRSCQARLGLTHAVFERGDKLHPLTRREEERWINVVLSA